MPPEWRTTFAAAVLLHHALLVPSADAAGIPRLSVVPPPGDYCGNGWADADKCKTACTPQRTCTAPLKCFKIDACKINSNSRRL